MCEECGGQLEKQWSLSGFQFKGEGWYVTDYAAKKGGAGGDKASTDSSASKEKSTSSESTTSTDSASKPVTEKPAKSESSKKAD